MKLVIQRTQGPVRIVCRDGEKLLHEDQFEGAGLVVLMGWTQADAQAGWEEKQRWLLTRTEGLRVFPDAQGRMNLNLEAYLESAKTTGGILWVSQFTLAAELESGFRPSFINALAPDLARTRFEDFVIKQSAETRPYKQIFGKFGSDMELQFTNWGPVTIPLEK